MQASLNAARPAGNNNLLKAALSPSPESSPIPASSPSPTPEIVPTPEPTPSVAPDTAPSPTQGVPAPNLPNLDNLRNVQPQAPETPDAPPSTQCSPAQPDCNPGSAATNGRMRRVVPALTHVPSFLEQMVAWGARHFKQEEIKTNHYRRGKIEAALPMPEPQTSGTYDDFVMARLDPDNRIGTGAEDILSRNFNWSLPLLSMTGRSGLNLGLSLSYNSLVWTKAGSYISYDADNGYPTPGFRLGFPTIYGIHYNSQTGTYGYLMLMPSGSRVELRRVGATNIYEAADFSYLQLTDNGDGNLLVRSTNGMQLSYISTSNGYRCAQVKDRNGNYLTISHNNKGRIISVTDTLGRVFNFNYDSNSNPISITQTSGSSQYTWATFGYTNLTLQTNFTGLTIVGTPNGTTLPVLSQVALPDGTYYKFSYNSWGQVYKITSYAADSNPQLDNHALNYVSYNLPLSASTAQTDCPRFTQRKVWAENWNNSNEAVTNYVVPSSTTWTMPDGTQQSGTFCQVQTPDGTYQNIYSHSSGWDEGKPLLVNTWANNNQQQLTLQKQVAISYTQDNTGVSYMLNPRVLETNIYDSAGNRRRTALTYSSFALNYGSSTLTYYQPYEVKEYNADAVNVLRTTQVIYNLGSAYTSRRIFNLVSQQKVYDFNNGNVLLSQIEYLYDENDGSGAFLVQQGTPVQHDGVNYGTSFLVGRGNLTSTIKRNALDPAQYTMSRAGYNTTGSVIFTRSPLQTTADQQTTITYTDWFSDLQNHSTYAYPTEVSIKDTVESTPSILISTKTQYNFETGAPTREEGPPPAGQSQGMIQTMTYDTIGRIERVTNAINNSYTRWVYPTSSNVVQQFTTINDLLNETVTAKLFDGAGQVRGVAADHPSTTNSVGGYVGQLFVYDVMGRVVQQSNPTEIYGSWQPAGDDAAGWVWSTQTYDWKGRPLVTTLVGDSSIPSGTREASYTGCGCAGGEVITLRDEMNRYSKVYHDILGRLVKLEELNSDQSIYRTMTRTYNALDQVLRVRQYQGGANSPRWQDTTTSYDGYGRMKTHRLPENDPATFTTFDYYNDDTLQKITDARGATTNYSYNNRQMVTDISYGVPTGSTIVVPTPISYKYDRAGNRTRMDDELGYVTYSYDPQSRLSSEVRNIAELSTNFTLNYTYNLGGELTSISDPNDSQRDVTYSYNFAGSLTTVTAHGFAGFSGNYASNMQYRAWGALKHINYGNTNSVNYQYNRRLLVSSYEVPDITGATFQYNASGQPSFVTDLYNPNYNPQLYDRSYSYDQVGRMIAAFSGSEAHTQTLSDARPYRETFQYDFWNNLTGRDGKVWAEEIPSFSVPYTDNRRQGWTYDADGRPLIQDLLESKYDAGGRKYWTRDSGQRGRFSPGLTIIQGFDGDGRRIRQQENSNIKSFLIRSTALGGEAVFEYGRYGASWFKKMGFVYAGGQVLALQRVFVNGSGPHIEWVHTNPVTKSQRSTTIIGTVGELVSELDPLGADAGLNLPEEEEPPGGTGGDAPDLVFPRFFDILNGDTGCQLDGAPWSCDDAMDKVNSGAAEIQHIWDWGGPGGAADYVSTIFNIRSHQEPWYTRQVNEPPDTTPNGGNDPGTHVPIIPDATDVTVTSWRTYYHTVVEATISYRSAPQTRQRRGGRRGGRPRRSTTQPPKKPVDTRSACDRFAEELASRLYKAVVENGDYNSIAKNDLGDEMVAQGEKDVDMNGYPYKKGSYPIDGFKTALVNNGQDADVYRHILFTAGNAIYDTSGGDAENALFRGYDWQQAMRGRAESETELRDDDAGMAVGATMLEAALGGERTDYWALKAKIKSILCDN